MSRALAAALAPSLALVLATLAAAGPAPRAATLKLEQLAPLTVSGRNFGAQERVLLLYAGPKGSSHVASTRAARNGVFRTTFRFSLGRCDSFTVRAVGTAGSRAVLQVVRHCPKTKAPPKPAPRKPKQNDEPG